MPTSDVEVASSEIAEPVVRRGRQLPGLFWVAAAWIGLIVAAALGADLLPLPSPTDMDMLERRMPPSLAHWLGTDNLGRDMLARLVYGARISLTVGVAAPLIGLVLGGSLGMLVGYLRGYLETIVVASADVLLAFPPLVFALALTAYLGQTIANLVAIIGILSIPVFTRVVRASTLSIGKREFILAARALGAGHVRILLKEVLPNVILPLMAYFLLAVAFVIVVEGALSFLGLGVPPPAPSWGSMIGEGRESLEIAPRIAFLPAGVMFATVLAFNIIGDTLRAITDPRQAAL